MADERELLPCPFCGGHATTVLVHDGWAVRCQGCSAEAGFDTTEEKVIRFWNTRAALRSKGGEG
jgi:Lar family restriction alleviation protein